MNTVRLYRMVKKYGGGLELRARDVRVELANHHLSVGWCATEREARYHAVSKLSEEYSEACRSVWNAKVLAEE